MIIIETFAPGCQPRCQPSTPTVAIRIDTLAALNAEIGMAIYERARADMMLDLRSKKPPATDAENVDHVEQVPRPGQPEAA
jgi:hypothetical protein